MANEFVAKNGLISQNNTTVTGSLIQGLAGNIATGEYSHAEGSITKAIGDYSHAEGQQTQAYGDHSHTEGRDTIASGSWSHAEGQNTIASGSYSHAEGGSAKAIGEWSHAEGDFTQAKGEYSHAEGNRTIASGSHSHAEGYLTIASGDYSHAEGYQTIALANHQHVQGQWNATSTVPAAFIVGNGTDDGNRSNLIHAAENKVEITGSLNVNGTTTAPTINTHQINPISGQDLYIQIPSGRLLDIWTDDNGGEIVLNSSGILLQTNATQNTWTFDKSGSLVAPGRITATSFTGSLQGTSSWATNSLTASYVDSLNQTLIITGSTQGNTVALSITSNTASLNLSLASFYTLQLVQGTNIYINPSNFKPGQSSMLLVSTTGSATVSFPSFVKQPSGSSYIPTTTTGTDILTFASLDNTNLYLVNVKNLI